MRSFVLKIEGKAGFSGILNEFGVILEPFWVNPDWLFNPTYSRNYGVREGTPCVFTFGQVENHKNYTRALLTKEWQEFKADLLSLQKFKLHFWELTKTQKDFIKNKFTALYGYKTFATNGTGFGDPDEPHANFIKNTDTDEKLPALQPFVCGTNTVYGRVVLNSREEEMVECYCFRQESGPPTTYGIEILNDPRVIYATNIKKSTNPDGTQDVFRFDQLNTPGDYVDVPYAFVVSEGNGYYPKRYLTQGNFPLYWPNKL